jgi:hypothetical protein
LCVANPVGPPIAEFAQSSEEAGEVRSFRLPTRKDARDVFPDNPSRPDFVSQSEKCESEISSRVFKSFPEAGDAETLTGSSTNEDVHISNCDGPLCVSGKISEVGDVGEPMLEDGAGEGFDFGEADRLPSERLPGD